MAKLIFGCNRIAVSNAEPPSFFRTFETVMPSIVTHFNLYWRDFVEIIKPLVRTGNYSMKELMESEWWWVKMLYDELLEDLKKEAKQKEKEREEQEKEYRAQQQQQQMQYANLFGSGSGNPYNFTMPQY